MKRDYGLELRLIEERVQDLEDSRELVWAAIAAPLYQRLERIERILSGQDVDIKRLYKVDDIIRAHVMQLLSENNGNKNAVSRIAGINIKTLYNWLTKWGVHKKRPTQTN